MHHEFLEEMAARLAARHIATFRYQFPYMEAGSKRPDPPRVAHAAVRFVNPTTGADVLPTIRAEMHRVRAGARTRQRREVGSSVVQVFDGTGTVAVGERRWTVTRGDLFVVPSWAPLTRLSAPIPPKPMHKTIITSSFLAAGWNAAITRRS